MRGCKTARLLEVEKVARAQEGSFLREQKIWRLVLTL